MSEEPEDMAEKIRAARGMATWLSFECTLGGNPADCQLHWLRLQSFEARRRFLEKLSDEECLQLFEKHRQCLARKEGRACSP